MTWLQQGVASRRLIINDAKALVVQNPYRMGYEGVQTAVAAINGEEVERNIDTGVTVVTMENFDTPEVQALLYPDLGE